MRKARERKTNTLEDRSERKAMETILTVEKVVVQREGSEIKRKTGRSKSYTDSVRKRNQHILVKRPTVRHRLRHRIQEVRLTSKPTYRARRLPRDRISRILGNTNDRAGMETSQ